MPSMSILRRSGALLLLLAISAFTTVPIAALRCDSRKACPMMAKRGLPCHGPSSAAAEGAGMAAPMSCCETRATVSPTGSIPLAVAPIRVAFEIARVHAAETVAGGGSLAASPSRDRLALHGVRRI